MWAQLPRDVFCSTFRAQFGTNSPQPLLAAPMPDSTPPSQSVVKLMDLERKFSSSFVSRAETARLVLQNQLEQLCSNLGKNRKRNQPEGNPAWKIEAVVLGSS